jgi:hypothetical protein
LLRQRVFSRENTLPPSKQRVDCANVLTLVTCGIFLCLLRKETMKSRGD